MIVIVEVPLAPGVAMLTVVLVSAKVGAGAAADQATPLVQTGDGAASAPDATSKSDKVSIANRDNSAEAAPAILGSPMSRPTAVLTSVGAVPTNRR